MTATICTICARGGSKGVKNKNIRQIAGLPLIAHSLIQARESGLFRHIAVSSDDPEILHVADAHGADILVIRPNELASDTAAKIPAIQHCLERAEAEVGFRFETLVDLDATSPLRNLDDLKAVVALLSDPEATNVITAAPARRSPYFNMVECRADGVPRLSKPLPDAVVRRQDAPACYDMNASIYAWRRASLFGMTGLFGPGTRLHVMPEERSVDIDSLLDFRFVELLLQERAGGQRDAG